MMKILRYNLLLLFLIASCGWEFYVPGNKDKQSEIIVSAYTREGCLEKLQEEGKKRGIDVKPKNVETEFGWEVFLFPIYLGYKCTGEVTGPLK